jgi:myo-inositol-1(or 4)-monophosphatase
MGKPMSAKGRSQAKGLVVALSAARAGGRVLQRRFLTAHSMVKQKRDGTFQTSEDLESERRIIDIIRRAYPGDTISSEELGLTGTCGSRYKWLIDPLDGTENFLLGLPYFSVSLTLSKDDEPILGVVYNPVTNQVFSAQKGKGAKSNNRRLKTSARTDLSKASVFMIPSMKTKRQLPTIRLRNALYNSCRRVLDTWAPALDWCLVADGRADAVVVVDDFPLRNDIRTLLLEESGGVITDFVGVSFPDSKAGLAVGSNSAALHRQLLELINRNYTNE